MMQRQHTATTTTTMKITRAEPPTAATMMITVWSIPPVGGFGAREGGREKEVGSVNIVCMHMY